MIPLTAIPWKLIGAGAAVLLVALMGWRVSAWHGAYKALPGVQDALTAEEACLPPSKCSARLAALQAAQEQVQREVVSGYEAEIVALRNRRPVVRRLCPDNRGLPDAGDAASLSATSAGGVVHGQAGEDPAVLALYALARDADEVRLRLKYLQQWNVALSQPGD